MEIRFHLELLDKVQIKFTKMDRNVCVEGSMFDLCWLLVFRDPDLIL